MAYSAGYAIADIAALKALSSTDLVNGYARWVIAKNTWYGWDSGSTLAGDNDTVVAINSAPATGRFIKGITPNRELLTSDRTYYVAPSGSDNNNGRTLLSSFLTIQKAVDVVANLDLGVYNAIIQLADGIYIGAIKLKTLVGAGQCVIQGNISSPGSVIIQTTGSPAFQNGEYSVFDLVGFSSTYTLQGFQIQSSGSNWRGILNQVKGSVIQFKNLIFGSGLLRHVCSFGGEIKIIGDYTIAASGSIHYEIGNQGKLNADFQPTTITLLNTPNFNSSFLHLGGQAFGYIASYPGYVSFSGTATGKRYNLYGLGYLTGAQNNLNYLPGNIAGTVAGNSIYE